MTDDPEAGPRESAPGRAEREATLLRWLDACEKLLEAGERVDLDRITAEDPALRGELEKCLSGLELVHRVGRGLRGGRSDSSSPAPSSLPESGLPETIGDFRIVREIGRGGMGIVYEAEQISLSRRVALKVLPFAAVLETKHLRRFQLEAQAAARLHHAHIVPVFSVGCERGLHFYAMQYVEGRALSAVIRELRERPSSAAAPGAPQGLSSSPSSSSRYFASVARLGAQVADALDHAHAAGIMHRDVKPSNILVDAAGDAWITDFGLARMHGDSSLTLSGDILGTLRYMSPEQARGRRDADHRADVYSLGVTLAELACLETLFDGTTREEVLRLVVEKEPRRLSQRGRPLPRDLETVILKAIAKDPADRYATARDFADDLRAVLEDKPIRARRPTIPERGLRWTRRHKPLAVAVAACIALLSVVGTVVWRDRALRRDTSYREAVRDGLLAAQTAEVTMPLGAGWFRQGVDYSEFDAIYRPREKPNAEALDPLARGLARLEEAIAIDPDAPAAHYHKGRLLHLVGRDDEALTALDRALAADARFVPARAMRALIREWRDEQAASAEELARGADARDAAWAADWLESQRAAREGRWQDAARVYERLFARERPGSEIFPGSSIETLLGSGVVLLEAGDALGALEVFSVAKHFWPEAIAPRLFAGKALYFLGDADRADRTFREVVEATGRREEVAREVLRLYVALWEDELALSWIDQLEPSSDREVLRANLCGRIGPNTPEYRERALGAANEAIRLDPINARAHATLACVLIDCFGNPAAAVEHAERARTIAPEDYLLRFWRGYDFESTGRAAEARKEYETAVDLNPLWSGSWLHLARVLRSLGRTDEALRAHERAIETRPSDWAAWVGYGNSLRHLGMLEGAEAKLREARRLHRRSTWACVQLGEVLLAQGRIDAAEEQWLEARTLAPKQDWPLIRLALFRRQRGESAASIRTLREALAMRKNLGVWAANELALALLDSPNPESALPVVLDGLRLRPHDVSLAQRLAVLARRPGIAEQLGTIEPALRADLEELALRREPNPWHLLNVALLPVHDPKTQDLERAATLLSKAVEISRSSEPDMLAALAEVETARGDRASAVRALETAWGHPDASLDIGTLLDAARHEARPLAPSFASIDAWIAELPADGAGDADALERFRSRAGTEAGGAILAYFEAIVRLRRGAADEACKLFDSCLAASPSAVEVWRRWLDAQCAAGSVGAAGRASVAEARLREHLVRELPPDPELWNLWFAIAVGGLGLELSILTERIPEAAASVAGDVRWIARALSQDAVARINCGGGEIEPVPGESWSRDRFFRGGQTRLERGIEIAESERDDVYRSHRQFSKLRRANPAYRVPLPRGTYELTLHFAETWWLERGLRRFDVVVEGETRVSDLDLSAAAGFRTTHVTTLTVEVRDGSLDIGFLVRADAALLSGIEVRRTGD